MATPRGHEACIGKIAKAGQTTPAQAQAIMDEVFDKGDREREAGYENAYARAAAEIAEKHKLAAMTERLDALRNAKKRAEVMREADVGDLKQGRLRSTVRNLQSMFYATPFGQRVNNVQTMGRARQAMMAVTLDRKLETEGVSKLAISGADDLDISKELWDLNAVGPKQPQGATGNAAAKTIADAIWPVLRLARDYLNNAGAHIADAVDYVAHTSHDSTKIRGAAGAGADSDAAFRSWWGFTKPRLAETTFDDVFSKPDESWEQAKDRFGRSVYEGLVTGIHKTPDGTGIGLKTEGSYIPPAFEGSRNLAKKASEARVLLWKDAQSWHDYAKQFGAGDTLLENVFHTIDQAARHSALMDRWGTNPAANFDMVFRTLSEKYRSDTDAVNAFAGWKNHFDNVLAGLDGRANMPINAMTASFFANVRTVLAGSMLGGVGVTHFASIWPTVTSELAHHGINRGEAMAGMIDALRKGRGTEAQRELDAELHAYHSGMLQDMMARWQAEDTVPGRISSVANTFMKWTGIHYVFNNTQAGVRRMLANNLARNTGKAFGELEPHLANMLQRYDIGEPEWNLLRAVPDLTTADGHSYYTPSDALKIDADAARQHLITSQKLGERPADATQADMLTGISNEQAAYDKSAASAHQDLAHGLADRLQQYYSDAAAHSTVTAGVRERAILIQGQRPGAFPGEALRFLAQFKSWPLAAWDQTWRRDFHQSLNGRDYVWNVGTLLGLSTIGGMMRMAINDAAIGNPQRDYKDPRTLLAGLAQGGGVGILGDYLFGETSRMGGGLVATAGGPAVGDIDAFVKLFDKFRDDASGRTPHKGGTYSDLWPDLAHFATRHVPFANLIYVKGALDYLAWYHMYEAVSPGWWERTNRRLEKERGRPMWGYSPGGGVPWGAPPIYGSNKAGESFGLLAH